MFKSFKENTVFCVKKENENSIQDYSQIPGTKVSFSWYISDNRVNPGERVYFVNNWSSDSFEQGEVITKFKAGDRFAIVFKPDNKVLKASDYAHLKTQRSNEKAYWSNEELQNVGRPADDGKVNVRAIFVKNMNMVMFHARKEFETADQTMSWVNAQYQLDRSHSSMAWEMLYTYGIEKVRYLALNIDKAKGEHLKDQLVKMGKAMGYCVLNNTGRRSPNLTLLKRKAI